MRAPLRRTAWVFRLDICFCNVVVDNSKLSCFRCANSTHLNAATRYSFVLLVILSITLFLLLSVFHLADSLHVIMTMCSHYMYLYYLYVYIFPVFEPPSLKKSKCQRRWREFRLMTASATWKHHCAAGKTYQVMSVSLSFVCQFVSLSFSTFYFIQLNSWPIMSR